MALTFGVLLGVILKKRRKPRLQQLRSELEKRKPEDITLYQFPAKHIFCMLVILLFSLSLMWFSQQIKKDLFSQETSQANLETLQSLPINTIDQTKKNEKTILSGQQKMSRVKTIINIAHLLCLIAIIAILSAMQMRIVKTNKRSKRIEATTYKYIFTPSTETYDLKEGDRFQIWQMGENRFSNTNYYYSIRAVGQGGSWEVLKKSNIFSSRTTVIQLGFLHSISYSTKVINKTTFPIENAEEE